MGRCRNFTRGSYSYFPIFPSLPFQLVIHPFHPSPPPIPFPRIQPLSFMVGLTLRGQAKSLQDYYWCIYIKLNVENSERLTTRAIQKFCNSVWFTNGRDKTITLLFNVISLYINTFLTFVKKLFYSSQIEFLGHVVEIRLHGLLQLIIIEKPRSAKVLLQMSK